MGYRSEVHLVLSAAGRVAITVASIKPELLKEADTIEELSEGRIHYNWDWVKWYDNYTDVMGVTALMDHFDQLENSEHTPFYGFIRMGEEVDDLERRGDPYELGMTAQMMIHVE